MTPLDISNKIKTPGFYFLPRISIPLRLLLIVFLVSTGIILQTINIIVGYMPVLSGIFLTLLKPVTNNPISGGRVEGKWVNVTDREFMRIRDHYVNTKKWADSYFNLFSLKGNLFFLILIGLGGCIGYYLSRYSISLVKIWALDCGTFIALFFLTGERLPYHPKILLLKIDGFLKLIEFLQKSPDPDIMIQPMMEINPVKKNSDIPTDARLTLKFRSAPSEFMGVQVQISMNRVGSRFFPYLYTVLLGRKGFDFKERLSGAGVSGMTEDLKKNYTLEPKQTKDVDILVFRQTTTKTSGYHTNSRKQREIVILSLSLAKGMLLEANKGI
jgi:hypothetical protein